LNNIENFSFLDKDLMSGIITATLSAIAFIYKWLKKMPDNDDGYFAKAGIRPYELKLSMSKFEFWKTKPLTKRGKIGYTTFAIILISLIAYFLYLGKETIRNQPNNWASLVLIKTKEKFLLSYDEAKNFPGENKWRLTSEDCHSDLYEKLAEKRKISLNLTYSVCSRIGLIGEKEGIEKRIKFTQRDKRASMLIFLAAILIFAYFLFAIAIDINIYHKTSRYLED